VGRRAPRGAATNRGAVPVRTRSWFDDEARLVDFVRQGTDLLVRGARRPFVTFLCALVVAGGLFALLVFGKRTHAPRLVFRVLEAHGDPSAMPNPKRRLATYVRDGIFTSQPLLEMMRRHGLYPTLAKNNPRAALETFRGDITVEAYQNYFVEERSAHDAPRSARVVVGYRCEDRETALAVTRELGELVVRRETLARREQAEQAAREAGFTRDYLHAALQRRTEMIAEKQEQMEMSTAPDPERQIELVGLIGSLGTLERDLETATRRAASLELGASLEQAGVGLRFEVADEAGLPSDERRMRWVAFAAFATFVSALPFAALGIGAFAPGRKP